MKKLVLSLFLVIPLVLVSCGNTDKTASDSSSNSISYDYSGEIEQGNAGLSLGDNILKNESSEAVEESTKEINKAMDRKIIESGSVSIETTKFDTAVAELESMVNKYSGYIESSNIYQQGINSSNYRKNRSADYSVRIPSDKFKEFLNSVGEIGVVTNKSTNANDVTSSYIDTETRLKVLQAQEQRYIDILNNTGTMTEILEVEKALSKVRYEIETLTGSLKQMDELVDLSTLDISIKEVEKTRNEKDVPVTLIEKMKDTFLDAIDGIKSIAEGIVIFVIAAVTYLAIPAVIIIIIIYIIRMNKKNKK